MILITSSIRDLAGILKFASNLTIEKFKNCIDKLHEILGKEENFIQKEGQQDPLRFSPIGAEKLTNFEGHDLSRLPSFTAVLERLTTLVEFSGKTGNEEMERLFKNLMTKPGYWLKTNIHGMDYSDARRVMNRNALEFASEQTEMKPGKHTITPQELEEMKELGVMRPATTV